MAIYSFAGLSSFSGPLRWGRYCDPIPVIQSGGTGEVTCAFVTPLESSEPRWPLAWVPIFRGNARCCLNSKSSLTEKDLRISGHKSGYVHDR
jgi:hypothetical protein